MKRCLATVCAVFALLWPPHSAAQPATSYLPLFYDQGTRRPMEIVATKTWGPEAEEPKEGPKNVASSSNTDAPLGPKSLFVGEVFGVEGKGPIKLALDYAGIEQRPTRSGDRDHWVVFNITLVCPTLGKPCYKAGNASTSFQNLFEVAPEMANSMARREVQVRGAKKTLLLGHEYFAYDLVPGALVRVFVSFNAPAHVETQEVAATLLYGDFTTQPPAAPKPERRPLGVNLAGKLIALFGLAAFGWIGLRRYAAQADEGPDEDAPRVLGALVATLGLALAGAGLVANALYFLVVGGLIAYSGLFLFFGRSVALVLYGLALALVWGWSYVEVGSDFKALAMRVALPTLIGMYLFSGAVSGRLARD